jgi:mediator of RNA polymerase II transcription subunit 18
MIEGTERRKGERGWASLECVAGIIMHANLMVIHRLQSSYFTDNNRFIHGNIIITVSQTSTPPRSPLAPTAPGASAAGDPKADPFGSPFPKERLRKVDDGWVLQAAVRVQSNTDVQSVNAGVQELLYLKKALESVCELDVVERLALDTRVR